MIDEKRIAEIRAQAESAPDESAIVRDVKVWLPKDELLQLAECYEAARVYVRAIGARIIGDYSDATIDAEEVAYDALLAHFPEATNG